jgi:hypothetical protein
MRPSPSLELTEDGARLFELALQAINELDASVLISKVAGTNQSHAELQSERDDGGMPRWFMRAEPDEGDATWVAVWLRPVDPLDERPSIRVTRYPVAWEEQQEADARAIADEHAEDA